MGPSPGSTHLVLLQSMHSSGEDFFEGILPYMGVAATFVMRPISLERTFVFVLKTWNWTLPSVGLEEAMFEIVYGRTTDGIRTDDRYLAILHV